MCWLINYMLFFIYILRKLISNYVSLPINPLGQMYLIGGITYATIHKFLHVMKSFLFNNVYVLPAFF